MKCGRCLIWLEVLQYSVCVYKFLFSTKVENSKNFCMQITGYIPISSWFPPFNIGDSSCIFRIISDFFLLIYRSILIRFFGKRNLILKSSRDPGSAQPWQLVSFAPVSARRLCSHGLRATAQAPHASRGSAAQHYPLRGGDPDEAWGSAAGLGAHAGSRQSYTAVPPVQRRTAFDIGGNQGPCSLRLETL